MEGADCGGFDPDDAHQRGPEGRWGQRPPAGSDQNLCPKRRSLCRRRSDRRSGCWNFRLASTELGRKAVRCRAAVQESERRSGEEHCSDGITEDIITALSKYRSLAVIARNSSFAFKG